MSRELTDAEVKVLTELSYKKSIKKGNKMNKELQAFKDLLKQLFPNYDVDVSFDDICNLNGNLNIIRNTLKALEIIKGFIDFNVYEMQGKYYLTTGNNYRGQIPISKEEFELLKEVLL